MSEEAIVKVECQCGECGDRKQFDPSEFGKEGYIIYQCPCGKELMIELPN